MFWFNVSILISLSLLPLGLSIWLGRFCPILPQARPAVILTAVSSEAVWLSPFDFSFPHWPTSPGPDWSGLRAVRFPHSLCTFLEPVYDDSLEILLGLLMSLKKWFWQKFSIHLHSCVISKDPVLSNKQKITAPSASGLSPANSPQGCCQTTLLQV